MSARHLSARLPLDVFPWNLALTALMKVCRENPNLVKIGQTYRSLYTAPFIVAGDIKSSYRRPLRVKWYQATRTAEEVQTLRERAIVWRCAYTILISNTTAFTRRTNRHCLVNLMCVCVHTHTHTVLPKKLLSHGNLPPFSSRHVFYALLAFRLVPPPWASTG
jgi:hypothetical protein